jgi:Spy/CpxP family protein refolding chaperone
MKRLDLKLKLLPAIIVVLGISISAVAQPPRRGPMPHRSMAHGHGLLYLDMSEEQEQQVKQLRLAHVKDVQPLRDEVKINRLKINTLMKNDDPDMEQIVSLVEANGKLLTQIQIKSIRLKINVRNLLTDEQKIIFDAHNERMGNRRELAAHYWHRRSPHDKGYGFRPERPGYGFRPGRPAEPLQQDK